MPCRSTETRGTDELIDGELLVSPSPTWTHQQTVGDLFLLIAPFAEEHRLGTTLFSPADLDLKSGQLVQPDLFVAARVGDKPAIEWSDLHVPLLIAEVLSPSTARYDRITKRQRFQRSQVNEYWIVDIDSRRIERWRPADQAAELVADTITWQPCVGGPVLTIDLDRYFAKVWRET